MAGEMVKVGYVARAHGIRGDVFVMLTSNRIERMSPGSELVCGGTEISVASSSRHGTGWIVHFKGVEDRNAAESLRGKPLSAEPIQDESEIWIDEVSGLPVYDQNGRLLGTVEALEANPASDILVLDSGVLVPLIFLTNDASDCRKTGSLHAAIPEGLVEIGL